jgi:hypothetical protein
VVDTVPADGAEGVPADSAILVSFSEAGVAPESVDEQSVIVLANDQPVTGQLGSDDKELTFTPDAPLEPNTAYEVRVTTGVKNPQGRPLQAAYTWGFRSAAAGSIVDQSPRPGATGITTNFEVTIQYDQPLDPASVAADSLVLQGPDGDVAGTTKLAQSADRLTFVLQGDLAHSSTYRVLVSSALRTSLGMPTIAAEDWTFATIDVTRPEVTRTIPADGEKRAERGAITIELSEPIDVAGVEQRGALQLSEERNFEQHPVSGEIRVETGTAGANSRLVFIPNRPLTLNGRYELAIANLSDPAGNGLAPSTVTLHRSTRQLA